MFQFKQFSILQEKSAMKVGTDGVLLGAWARVQGQEKEVLDIGTGTGLIALMLAQRTTDKVNISAVEVEKEACEEAQYNFENSKWNHKLSLYNTSIKNHHPKVKYDVIVCNPPYFTDTLKTPLKTARTLARHVDDLSFKELLTLTANLLPTTGNAFFVIPFKEEEYFIALAKESGLFVNKITRVKGREEVAVKRSLLAFSKQKHLIVEDELVIEIDRHVYTQDYINLTKEFYLKM